MSIEDNKFNYLVECSNYKIYTFDCKPIAFGGFYGSGDTKITIVQGLCRMCKHECQAAMESVIESGLLCERCADFYSDYLSAKDEALE